MTSNCHPPCISDTAEFGSIITRVEDVQKATVCCMMTLLPGFFADPGATNCSA